MKNKNVTIRKVVQYLNNREYDGGFWLPNIQRPFVWGTEQIEKLFDSIMRQYPISTLLVWRTRSPIKRRRFIDAYRDDVALSAFQVPEDEATKLLVLDGQQRLQSLYIGLCGSYNKEELYFSVLSGEAGSADDMRYKFRFMKPAKASFPWVKFSSLVFSDAMPHDLSTALLQQTQGMTLSQEQKDRLINNLWQVKKVFAMDEVIGYQELDSVDSPDAYTENDVVEIFIRANSGGTKLGKSDLLFSLLTASWDDADEAIEDLLGDLNASGYAFTRDFILKTCLVLLGKGAAYDVKKFRDDHTKQAIVAQWKQISAAIRDVRDYLYSKTFIRSDHALPSYLTLIPIIYYRFHYAAQWQHVQGVDTYLLRTLLCGAFSGRPDGLIDKCIRQINQSKNFVVGEMFDVIHNDGRNLDVTDDTLLQASYGSKTIHLIFNLWYRQFNYQPAYAGNLPQVDHVFPQSVLRAVKDHNPQSGRQALMRYPTAVRDQLANCMLLTADENGFQGKCDKLPAEWFADKSDKYLQMHLIPARPSLWELDKFDEFIEARKALITEKLRELVDAVDSVTVTATPDPATDQTPVSYAAPSVSNTEGESVVAEVVAEPDLKAPARAENTVEPKGDTSLSVVPTPAVDAQNETPEGMLATYFARIAEPSNYIAGFRTEDGKELALERSAKSIVLWTQPVRLEGGEWSPRRVYAATSARNSNLNRKNCPALRLGNPVLHWKLTDLEELLDFINWYSSVEAVTAEEAEA